MSTISSALPPLGLRVAATLCAVVGLLSALAVIVMESDQASRSRTPALALLTNPAAAVAVCVAAVLLWRRRKWGGYLLVAAAIVPNLVSIGYGIPLRMPGLLMLLAIITVAVNWAELR
jgi:hypothetical protein